MRRFFSWALCSVLLVQSGTVVAQHLSPIKPNYGRTSYARSNDYARPSSSRQQSTPTRSPRLAAARMPSLSDAIGTGLKETVIPQQGSVDLGVGRTSSALPSPAYTLPSPGHTMSGTPVQLPGSTLGLMNAGPMNAGPMATGSIVGPAFPSSSATCGPCQTGVAGPHAGYGAATCSPAYGAGGAGLGKLKRTLGKLHLPGSGGHCGGWFGGFYYLHLNRGDDNFGKPLAYDSANPTMTVLATGFARMDDSSAAGVRVGKMINPCSAIEFIYWQAFPDDQTAVADAAFVGAPVSSFIDFQSLAYDNFAGGGPSPVNDYFTDAQYMSVTRTYDYSNFELNFIKLPFVFGGNQNARARLALLAGVRYFRAEEQLSFFSDDLNNMPYDDPANELRYYNEIENNLIGFQLGALLDWQFTCRLSGQLGSKVGIYNNYMRHVQAVAGGTGSAFITTGPYAGQAWALDTDKEDFAFLGEIDAGLSYCVTSNWRLTGGYKFVTVSGYATATRQLPQSYDNLAGAGLIHNEDSLMLHGAYLGAEFCW